MASSEWRADEQSLPHTARYSEEGARALQRLAAEKVARILLGQPPRCPVN